MNKMKITVILIKAILIKAKNKTKTRTIMDIYVKYNQIRVNKKINEKQFIATIRVFQ